MCVGEGVRFSTSPYVKKITNPLQIINDGPYNKKSQESLRRLSFFFFFKDITWIIYFIFFIFICYDLKRYDNTHTKITIYRAL